jgi:signal transduction histidine kinase
MSRAGAKPKVRCAVYTRKSSDEGLELTFNSLDAQREACAAYIDSQRHEGWLALDDRYDDGGYSGGTLERPALQRLIRDIEAGRVDTVVCYKIDRLSRSLTDFAKLRAGLGTDVNAPPMAEAGPSEIVQAARAFNQMQERIQRLVDDRTRMLAAIAHDLRTVLTRLRLRAELIDDAEQQRKAIADLDAMAIMLDETLAFARDDGAGESRQDVDLAEREFEPPAPVQGAQPLTKNGRVPGLFRAHHRTERLSAWAVLAEGEELSSNPLL